MLRTFRRPLGLLGRGLPPVALAAGLWLLLGRLEELEPEALKAALARLGLGAAGLAVVFTILSFAAVARFELTVRRVLGLQGPRARAMRAGAAAVAVAQTVGFGALSGALARWRALPELGLLRATELSAAVSLSFMAALAVLSALVLLVVQAELGLLLALGALAVALILRLAPGRRVPGLSPGRGAALMGWAALDLTSAALVLACLLPAGSIDAPLTFFAAYLVALAAGFLSQSPGGIGAFELTLITLLPAVPQADLVAALIGYRVIYHLLPALAALGSLARPAVAPGSSVLLPAAGPTLDRALASAPQGDWALALQGAQVLLTRDRAQGWLTGVAGGALVAIGSPLGAARPDLLAQESRSRGLRPLLYKACARSAGRARRAGWPTVLIGQEAWLTPATWSAERPECRNLRRKLRAAQAANLLVEVEPAELPLTQMATLAALWAARSGGEMGFSMGRFSAALVTQAVVVLAWHEGRLAGFLTLNRGQNEWALDLMRLADTAPDGTMHALLTRAISAARAAGVPRLSLAAVPQTPRWLPGPVARRVARPGLRQFKAAFGPRWRPLYLAAPGRLGLVRGLLQVAHAVHYPGPLAGQDHSPRPARPMQNRFDLGRPACHALEPNATGVLAALVPRTRPNKGQTHDQRPFPPA